MESPRYEGRVIAAVWGDPEMIKLAGKTLIGAELGKRYGVSDIPGFNPKCYASITVLHIPGSISTEAWDFRGRCFVRQSERGILKPCLPNQECASA